MGEVVGGTVIQRSFIGREAANIIHIATVPVSELGISSEDPERILAEVLGIPASNVLDGDNYLTSFCIYATTSLTLTISFRMGGVQIFTVRYIGSLKYRKAEAPHLSYSQTF